jgi:hypothetical protein
MSRESPFRAGNDSTTRQQKKQTLHMSHLPGERIHTTRQKAGSETTHVPDITKLRDETF